MDRPKLKRRSRARSNKSNTKSIDLTRLLTFRVVAIALACFSATITASLIRSVRDIKCRNEALADIVVKGLEVQLFRIDSQIGIASQFPDWEPISQVAQSPGQCITYAAPSGKVERSSCVGIKNSDAGLSPWLTGKVGRLLGNATDESRMLNHRGKIRGTIYVTSSPAALISTLWDDCEKLLGLTAMMVVAICVIQYVAIRHALRPAQEILEGLDRLRRGELEWRLPNFQLIELQQISDVFNAMAESLLKTTQERKDLAAKLVDGQEQERSRLARELHDELAQSLSAIGALAASISTTAAIDCPLLVPETTRLRETSQTMMKSLRATLSTLRAPEIDDFGLAIAISRLKSDHERLSAGRLEITLTVKVNLSKLPEIAGAHIYRIVQEGLTNITKHANASKAEISIDFINRTDRHIRGEHRWLSLRIVDNGSGIEPVSSSEKGFGLIGMRERVSALGGELAFFEPTGYGFGFEAYIPMEATSELGT